MAEGSIEFNESQEGEAPPAGPAAIEDRHQAARAQFAARRAYKRALRRAANPLYFSFSSLALTVILVLVAGAATLALIFTLPVEPSARDMRPLIEVVESSLDAAAAEPSRAPQATSAPAIEVILAAETPERFVLAGPPIPTVIVTKTPVPLRIGVQAAVFDVGNDKLNIRSRPSLSESQVLFRESEGARFDIIGGPQEADGFTWWQVRDPQFQVEGWAVAIYLRTVTE